jgi:hypothetical protein
MAIERQTLSRKAEGMILISVRDEGVGLPPAEQLLILALSGHSRRVQQCPLLGVKRTSQFQSVMSAFDPKRTLAFPHGLMELGLDSRRL